MPCERFLGGIICTRGRRKGVPKCWVNHCPSGSTRLCDWPTGPGKTCDNQVCGRHADRVGPDKDYCPLHSIMHAKARMRTGR
jgi:hypothetical protein